MQTVMRNFTVQGPSGEQDFSLRETPGQVAFNRSPTHPAFAPAHSTPSQPRKARSEVISKQAFRLPALGCGRMLFPIQRALSSTMPSKMAISHSLSPWMECFLAGICLHATTMADPTLHSRNSESRSSDPACPSGRLRTCRPTRCTYWVTERMFRVSTPELVTSWSLKH